MRPVGRAECGERRYKPQVGIFAYSRAQRDKNKFRKEKKVFFLLPDGHVQSEGGMFAFYTADRLQPSCKTPSIHFFSQANVATTLHATSPDPHHNADVPL